MDSHYHTLLKVFQILDNILEVNCLILHGLRKRYKEWSDKQAIVDLIRVMTPFLNCYKEYSLLFHEAQLAITYYNEEPKKPSKNFTKISDIIKGGVNHVFAQNRDLQSLIVQPIQRVPRYVLLLQQIQKLTPNDHPDFEHLEKSLTAMKRVADEMNTRLRQAKSSEICLKLHDKFGGQFNTKRLPISSLMEAHRFFVKSSLLSSGSRLYLFNDLLICATPSFLGKMTVDETFFLEKIQVFDGDDKCFYVQNKNNKLKLVLQNEKEKKSWMETLQSSIESHKAIWAERWKCNNNHQPSDDQNKI